MIGRYLFPNVKNQRLIWPMEAQTDRYERYECCQKPYYGDAEYCFFSRYPATISGDKNAANGARLKKGPETITQNFPTLLSFN